MGRSSQKFFRTNFFELSTIAAIEHTLFAVKKKKRRFSVEYNVSIKNKVFSGVYLYGFILGLHADMPKYAPSELQDGVLFNGYIKNF